MNIIIPPKVERKINTDIPITNSSINKINEMYTLKRKNKKTNREMLEENSLAAACYKFDGQKKEKETDTDSESDEEDTSDEEEKNQNS